MRRLLGLALLVMACGAVAADARSAQDPANGSAAEIERRLSSIEDALRDSQRDARAAELRAERSRREAARRAAEVNRLASEAAAARAEAERQARESKQRADRDAEIARRTAEERKRLVQSAAELKAEIDRRAARERLTWLRIGGGVLVAAIAALAIALRLRRRRALTQPVANCVLEGEESDLLLPGAQLPAALGGVVLGRNPAKATAVLSKGDVGREHARFEYRDGSYFVEHLGSENGTFLNGVPLESHAPAALASGDRLTFSVHQFQFRILK